MAEAALQKLEDHLNCPICLDTYTDPKQLQCHHVYCQKCLKKLVDRDQQGQLILTCPTCRQVTPVPANGVAGLQGAFQTSTLLDIVEEHKKASAKTEKVESESTSATACETATICCREHYGEEVGLYCATCEEPICLKCVVNNGPHHGHNTELLSDAFEKYKGEISASLEPMERQVTTINDALTKLDTRCREISDQQADTEANIHDTFTRLHEILDARKAKLLEQLHNITQRKLKSLATQRDQIETILIQLTSCLDYVKESFKTGSRKEVLMMKTNIVKQVNELTTTFQPDILKPSTEADVAFSTSANLPTLLQTCHNVFTPQDRVDPSKCHTLQKSLESITVGEKLSVILQAVNYKGISCEILIPSSECEIVSDITGYKTKVSIERQGPSQYEITCQPNVKGRHHLCVKMEGQHISGSPFTMEVTSPVEKLGTPILTIDRIDKPYGVAINQRGEIVVTEFGGDYVSIYSPSGEKLRSFGTSGFEQGQFENPAGVAVDSDGNILVADSENCRIQKFSADGEFLATVGTRGSGPHQFACPRGIAVNKTNNKVYVVDRDNARVQILNSDLTFYSTFGQRGSGEGQFNWPYGVTCDTSGNVYIADRNLRCIQVFTAEGKFLRVFSKVIIELEGLLDITTDINDLVYVTDEGHRLYVFNPRGELVTSFGKKGTERGKFDVPAGVAVDSSGVVYVCDHINWRVQLF